MLEICSEENKSELQIDNHGKHTTSHETKLSHCANKVSGSIFWISVALNVRTVRSFGKIVKPLISHKSHGSGSDSVLLENCDVINEQTQVCYCVEPVLHMCKSLR